ncbi:hypothetical protein [Achromobacter piechaudii]|uniref:Uncharacterized protein n=1 Tax=Achromobacter piechaudii ATCC 43553 TaxID=742159 RepID=D4X7N1_9BURK|nr:hypothetical protein [Achromobacter piechaudii]EFF77177.1 hypothetical protein HMPREF0004_1478 [Achromobacter piechaudii ATCC 43553]
MPLFTTALHERPKLRDERALLRTFDELLDVVNRAGDGLSPLLSGALEVAGEFVDNFLSFARVYPEERARKCILKMLNTRLKLQGRCDLPVFPQL